MSASPPAKLGIIAGSGHFPERLIAAAQGQGREVFVLAFDGETDMASLSRVPHAWVQLGHIGDAIGILREQGISDLVLAGRIRRPSFSSLRVDMHGMKLLSRLIKAQFSGDNALFTTIIGYLEEMGFRVIGAIRF